MRVNPTVLRPLLTKPGIPQNRQKRLELIWEPSFAAKLQNFEIENSQIEKE